MLLRFPTWIENYCKISGGNTLCVLETYILRVNCVLLLCNTGVNPQVLCTTKIFDT